MQRTAKYTRRGFTLIELLVVISIVALLLSVLLPALRRAKSSAQESVCKSNLRQLGTAVFAYASSSGDKLPPVYYFGQSKNFKNYIPGQDGYYCWPMYVLRRFYDPSKPLTYVGWGPLWDLKMLETPNIFYCPSQKGRRDFYSYYNPRDSARDVVEPMWEDRGTGKQELLRGGYSYSPLKKSPVRDAAGRIMYWPLASRTTELGSNTVLGVDMLLSWDHLTHKRGSGKSQYANLNVIAGDGSVTMYEGRDILTQQAAERWADFNNNIPTKDFFNLILAIK